MSNNNTRRPWFGPKRVGWGLRPQTWQGWTIVVLAVIVILGIAFWVRH